MSVPDVSPARLPRGRHGIDAEVVAASQRQRLMRAVIQVVGERGWSETRIADVVAAAAVSRRTFYELFGGLEACFMAAVDAGFDLLTAALDEPDPAGEIDFEARVRRFLRYYLQLLEATPGATRALHIEMVRATDEVRAQHDRVMDAIGERLLASRFGDGDRTGIPADVGVALVAGFEHLLSRHIRGGGDVSALASVIDDAAAIAVRALAD
ncbi:TetR/AcrR family transcriptional regulator [Nocardioides jejuensis]|uniref:TetR/AcrR family transcriptional regulator n=1 Tax=Nocardioides jejuensis TaxID=2502782 RepID=A0A4V2NZK6_9ACTN|nr:TetR/AcrR family transcriptional regulator [Nocardioides jejuensis]TCJ29402.1 TetR/AcrR family transcriptional regulator [Nocardioides jejuensis]